jgi:hypothetical protein
MGDVPEPGVVPGNPNGTCRIEVLETIAMRVLLGGIIGATVAVAAWLGLEHVTQMNLGWLSCGVGVITGYCVHRAAGPNSGGSFVRGGLSVVLALVAIVGGQQIYAKVMEANADKALAVVVASETAAEKAQDDTAENSIVPSQQSTPIDERRPANVGTGPVSMPTLRKTISEWDMLWMCLAALAAYIVGKGRNGVLPPAPADEPQSEPQSPSTNGQ